MTLIVGSGCNETSKAFPPEQPVQ